MKILLVANGYPPTAVGGVETYTAALSRSLAEQGHSVRVFCRESDFSRPDYEILLEHQDEIAITRVANDYKHATSFRQTFSDPRIDQIFSDFIQAEQPDLIHFNHFIGLSAHLPFIAVNQHIPSVITLHDFWPICHQVKLIDWQGRICPGPAFNVQCSVCVVGGPAHQNTSTIFWKSARLAKHVLPASLRRSLRAVLPGGGDTSPWMDSSPQIFRDRLKIFTQAVLAAQRVLVPSEYVRTQLNNNGFPIQRIDVVPLGIALRPDHPARKTPPDRLTFAAIGPIQPIKGMDIAIKAFSKVPGDHLRLKIIGRHDLYPRDHIEQVFKMAQADPRVSIEGPFDPAERAAIFDTFDILIVPSPAPETFSLVAHEALVMGKPVLAARLGALPEIIQDGNNGFLFEAGNDVQLAELITSLATDPGLKEKLSPPGKTKIITTEDHARQIESIYNQVVKASS